MSTSRSPPTRTTCRGIPGRCARLTVDGVLVGHAGELHPNVVAAHGLPARPSRSSWTSTSCSTRRRPSRTRRGRSRRSPWPRRTSPSWSPRTSRRRRSRRGPGRCGRVLGRRRGRGDPVARRIEGEQVGVGNRSLAFALRLRETTGRSRLTRLRVCVTVVAEANRRFGAVASRLRELSGLVDGPERLKVSLRVRSCVCAGQARNNPIRTNLPNGYSP